MSELSPKQQQWYQGLPNKTQRKYKAAERQRDAEGHWWQAPRAAARFVGYAESTLDDWYKHGCPAMPEEKLVRKPFHDGLGQSVDFYSEQQLERLKVALA